MPERSPAEIYDALFVPALFAQWGEVLAACAALGPGDRVLDVGCGTGVLALAARDRVGPKGGVVGLDRNADMLAVASRKSAAVEWREARAEALPFADASFDAVVSQFALMFFDDRVAALGEMRRVLRPGGRLALAVCDAVERSPGYAALAALLERLFGARIAEAFRAPFVLGNEEALAKLCASAGFASPTVERKTGTVRFASIEAMISTERACIFTLGGLLDDAQFARLLEEARSALAPYAGDGGRVAFEMPALVVTARR